MMQFCIQSLVIVCCLAEVVISQCPQKLRRTFDFHELDPHFQLIIDDIEGRKANKALQGSIDIYEGRKNQDVNIFLKYVFQKQNNEDNRGFNGKICFKLKNAVKLNALNRGIPYMHCDFLPMGETCYGFPGIQKKLEKPFSKKGQFVQHCLTVESSEIKITLTAQDGQKIQMKQMFIRACEQNTKRIDETLVQFPDLQSLLQGLLDLDTKEPP